MKKIISVFLCIVFICLFSVSVFAVDYSTYSDLTATGSQVSNLLSLRDEKDVLKDYIIIRTQDDYILFIADKFTVNNNTITANNVTQIVYRNTGISGQTTRYYSTQGNNIKITKNHVVVSNFLKGASKVDNTDYFMIIKIVLICILAVLVFWVIRRFK